ncbi:MAG: hypothetical protein JNN25_05015 [Candidatus Kapabacteria bacterium]|nr:hypothetical protein [Candidatus Kapabacteria bacterium]
MTKLRCFIVLMLSVFFLTSCAGWRTVQHLGRSYSPVSSIDIIYADKDIKAQKYEFMGEVFMNVFGSVTPDLEQLLIAAAKERGASAILITYNLTAQPSSESSVVSTPILRGRLIRYL